MQKARQIKGKRRTRKQKNVYAQLKKTPVEALEYQASCKNCAKQASPQKVRKDLETSKDHNQNMPKYKKVKFLTEQIEKSVEGELVFQPLQKKANLLKISTLNYLEDLNVYYRYKSVKKDKKNLQKNQILSNNHENNRISLNSIHAKQRQMPKSHSKSNLKMQFKAAETKRQPQPKSVPKMFFCITDRKAKQSKILNPEIIEQQISYYFQNDQNSLKKDSKEADEEEKKSTVQTNRTRQKKQKMFIYESKQGLFRNSRGKKINLGSTRDLLN